MQCEKSYDWQHEVIIWLLTRAGLLLCFGIAHLPGLGFAGLCLGRFGSRQLDDSGQLDVGFRQLDRLGRYRSKQLDVGDAHLRLDSLGGLAGRLARSKKE